LTDQDVRPYWGEESEPVGEWALHWTHVADAPHAPISDHLDARVARFTADGVCAMCMAELDEDGVCAICGFNPALPRKTEATVEQLDDYVTTLPSALRLDDEFAPAQLEAEVA
jgi:hypothetical protein